MRKIVGIATGSVVLALFGAALTYGILFSVGETIETITDYSDCPEYYRCTPKGDWNDSNCKCWEKDSNPTADQRYGCTVKQQAPNGECK